MNSENETYVKIQYDFIETSYYQEQKHISGLLCMIVDTVNENIATGKCICFMKRQFYSLYSSQDP